MASRQEYEMLFKLGAQVNQGFNQTFTTAQKVLTATQKEIAALYKVQGDISSYTKQKQSVTDDENKLAMYKKQLEAVRAELNESGTANSALASKEAELEYKVKSATGALQQKKDKLDALGKSLEDAGVDTSQLSDETQKLKEKMEELKSEEEKAGEEAKKMGDKSESAFFLAGEALISAGIAKGLKEIVDFYAEAAEGAAAYADEIGTTSIQYGIAAKDLQAYTYAAELLDVDVNTITSSLSRNTRAMYNAREGSEQYVEAYNKLGVSVTDGNGNLRDAQTVYWEVIDALGAMANETERDGIAMTLLGRNAMELNTLIKAGSGVMKEYTAMAQEAGYILSDEVLTTLQQLDDQEQLQQKNMQALKNTIGAAVAPELTKLKELQNELLVGVTAFASEHPGLVKGIALIAGSLSGMLTVYTAYKGVKAAMIALRKLSKLLIKEETAAKGEQIITTQGATVAQHGLNAAMKANPIGIVITGITLLTTVLTVFKSETKQAFEEATAVSREYAEEIQKLKEENEKLRGSYERSIAGTEASADMALSYVERLKELEEQGIKTAKQQEEYNQLLERIKAVIPDINLQIDEQTGLYKGGAEALKEEIHAQKELIKLNAIKEHATNLEKTQYENLAKIRKITEEINKEKEYFFDLARGTVSPDFDSIFKFKVTKENVDSLSKSLEEAQEIYNDTSTELDLLWDEYEKGIGVVENTRDGINDPPEYAKTVAQNVLSLAEAYAKVEEEAKNSIEGQYQLWDTAAVVIPKDISEINTALETQASYWKDYTTDLAALKEKTSSIEGLSEVISAFADGSADSVNVVAGLAKASDEEIANFVATYRQMQAYQKEAATALAETKTGLEAAIDELNLSDEAKAAGKATIDAYIQAIKDGTADAETAIYELAKIISVPLNLPVSSIVPTKEKEPSDVLDDPLWTNRQLNPITGYAKGTSYAAKGWHMVGEEGPELAYFRGGDTVYDANETAEILTPQTGTTMHIQISPQFNISTADTADELKELLDGYSDTLVEMVVDAIENDSSDRKRRAYA